MQIKAVTTPKDRKDFLDVARLIYQDDPEWICPLDVHMEEIFDPEKNIFAKEGDYIRWILKDDKGKLIGRVAAFINRTKAQVYEIPTGGLGFFECIDDKKAAFLLFDHCKDWLMERDMKAMLGPINLGENDKFWGLLVEGFTKPAFGMQYHKSYYKAFFEEYGFDTFFEQLTNKLILDKRYPERFYRIAEWLLKKPGYSFKPFSYSEKGKFIDEFVEIYNDAWLDHDNYSQIKYEDIEAQLNEAKSFMVEEFIWFAYFENEPIGLVVMMPDINPIIKRFNGKMNLLNKLRFLLLAKRRLFTRARMVVMGVKRKYQNHGVESGFFWHMEKVMEKHPEYKEVELSWVGDFNPKMLSLHKALGGTPSKKHITYRFKF
ncbi:MAG: GNAT family N-acetyltransferase [Bacteroidetes bacterium]|nr:GNAT family N-acetyltransferase [Bacteroidota bacterium]